MQEQQYHVPTDRHYEGDHHLWAQSRDGGARIRVGIDSLGLESLGDLAYVTLREVGTTIARGDPVGSLEAAKMTSAITAPIGGSIVARNDDVLADPLLVNEDPYGRGWLIEIEPTAWDVEAAQLISGDAIEPWAAIETERLREEPLVD